MSKIIRFDKIGGNVMESATIMRTKNDSINANDTATIFDVANYFINKSDEENLMTPLKLQKICYYAQAWSLVWEGEELFHEDFQAWVHGPANYDLFKKYQGQRYIDNTSVECNYEIFNEEQIETLEIVWEAYGKYSGDYLEQLTHQEDPWIKTRGNLSVGDKCDRIIKKDIIKKYYESLNAEEK